ncbi:MAG: ATP-grasp domain-containing protein [Hyphomicrobiaceae bacterium]
MLLYEHEGKALLSAHGIAVPNGQLAASSAMAVEAAENLTPPVMVKCQVLAGGRGKAGGVVAAFTPAEVDAATSRFLGACIKDEVVRAVLVEERVALSAERYMAMLLDGERTLLVIGRSGGVEVEELYAGSRDGFEAIVVDPTYGLSSYQVRTALQRLEIAPASWPAYADVAVRLDRLFRASDATLVEINPLAELTTGALVALDARISIDDGALFRQPGMANIAKARVAAEGLLGRMNELEVQYVPMGGSIGLVSSGAGVGTTIMDWVDLEGAKVHSFVDLDYAIMSGRTEDGMRLVLDTLLDDASVRAIIVNFTTCGLQLDEIGKSLVNVLDERKSRLDRPVLIHLQGNRAPIGQSIVRKAGYEVVDRLGDAVREAVAIAKGGRA